MTIDTGLSEQPAYTTRMDTFPPTPTPQRLVIDLIDEDTGLADVEDSEGRTFQVPVSWLPDASEGAAYRVDMTAQGVIFTPDPQGARLLRERSKQTLLDFTEVPEAET